MTTFVYAAGIGCRSGCAETSLRELLEQSLRAQPSAIDQLRGIASIDRKQNEIGLLALGERLRLPLAFFSAEELNAFADRVGATAAVALERTGSASVAEACALALAERLSGNRAELVIRKCRNADATFAVARAPSRSDGQ